MSVAWGKDDADEREPLGLLAVIAYTGFFLLSGFVWYGLLLAGAWVLRHLGVNITGMPR